MSLKDVCAYSGLGWDSVKRIVKTDMAKEAANVNLQEVKCLAIDEVYLGRLHKFITLVIDWQSGRVLCIAKGRGENALRPFFRQLRRAKADIQAVATDLGAAYAAAVVKNLPGAVHIADRFHIIKLMNEKIDELRRALQREADIMGRKAIKGTRYLLLRGRENLHPNQLPKLEEALKLNEPLSLAYYLKEALRQLWCFNDIRKMTAFFDDWCCRVAEIGIPLLVSLAKTFRRFRSSIINAWTYPISNGKIEGINNKIGAMQRLHYGLRDFNFLSLRILTLHRAKHTFLRMNPFFSLGSNPNTTFRTGSLSPAHSTYQQLQIRFTISRKSSSPSSQQLASLDFSANAEPTQRLMQTKTNIENFVI